MKKQMVLDEVKYKIGMKKWIKKYNVKLDEGQ